MSWEPPTKASVDGLAASTIVRCAGCPRRVMADRLYHVPGHGWRCDACKEQLFRHGKLSKADYLKAVGAPAALVRRHGG